MNDSWLHKLGIYGEVTAAEILEMLPGLPLYPEETEGSIMARRARIAANHLSSLERQLLWQEAVSIIYAEKKY